MSAAVKPPAGAAGLSIRALVRRSASIFAGSTGEMVALFLQGVIVANTLGAALLGVWALIQATATLVQTALGFRTVEALARFLVEYRDEEHRPELAQVTASSLYLECAVGLLSAAVVWLVSPWVAAWYHHEAHLGLFRLYCVVLLVSWVRPIWASMARARLSFKYLAGVPFGFTVAQVGAVAALWAAGRLNLPTLVLTIVLRQVAQATVQASYVVGSIRHHYQMNLAALTPAACARQWRRIRPFWQFMTTGYLENTIRALQNSVDVFAIGAFAGTAAVGRYRLATQLLAVFSGVATALTTVSYQEFNEYLADGKGAAIRGYVCRLTARIGRVMAVFVPLAWLVSRPVVTRVYGPEFAESALLLNILLVGGALSASLFWARPLLLALHGLRYWVLLVYLNTPVSALLMLLAARYLGAPGVAAVLSLNPLVLGVLPALKALALLGERPPVAVAPAEPPGTAEA